MKEENKKEEKPRAGKKEHKHINRIVESLFLIKKSRPIFFLVLLFDALFFLSVFFYNKILGFILPLVPFLNVAEMAYAPGVLWASVFVLLIYAAFLCLIYTFFKHCVLYLISGYFSKKAFGFSGFLRMFLANLLIAIAVLAYYMAISIFAFTYIKSSALIALFGAVMLLPIAYFGYPYITFVQHLIFARGERLGISLAKGFKMLKDNIAGYSAMYLACLLALAGYALMFLAITEGLNLIIFHNNTFSLIYQAYQNSFIGLTFLILWLAVFFMRAYLYKTAEEQKDVHK